MSTEKQPSSERRVRSKVDGDHEDLFESSTETGIKVYVKLELPAVGGALLEGTKQDGKRAATDAPPRSRAPKKQKKAAEQGSKEKKKGDSETKDVSTTKKTASKKHEKAVAVKKESSEIESSSGSSNESSDQKASTKESGSEQRSPYPHTIGVQLSDLPQYISRDERIAAIQSLLDIVAMLTSLE